MIDPNLAHLAPEVLAETPIKADSPHEKTRPRHPLHSNLFVGLLICLFANMVLFGTAAMSRSGAFLSDSIGQALLGHLINMIGLIALLANRKQKQATYWHESGLLWLNSCMFTCLTLNLEVRIFSTFENWVACLIGLSVVNALAFAWRHLLPQKLHSVIWFSFGLHTWLCTYLSVYLSFGLVIGVPAMLAFGLGLYFYIPLLFLVAIGIQLYGAWTQHKWAFLSGIGVLCVVCVVFLQRWHGMHQVVQEAQKNTELPVWASVAQKLKPDWMAWRFLGKGLFYRDNLIGLGDLGNRFARENRHDPFVVIAANGDLTQGEMMQEDKIRTLQAVFAAQHDTETRLWTGQSLTVSKMHNEVSFTPELSLAQTSLTLDITNTGRSANEEAIFTFHLPASSAVSAMSLWINGVEEKAHLSTRDRATRAYNTIVGGERRDPSLLHWKEGNTISLRVFPCTPKEPRQVKIVYHTPLRSEGEHLVYENAWFEGPPMAYAAQSISVKGNALATLLDGGCALMPDGDGSYKNRFRVGNHWQIYLKKPALSSQNMHLQGKTYQIKPLVMQELPFAPEAIYLDANAAWSQAEWKQVLAAAGQTPCMVRIAQKWEPVTPQNQEALFRSCAQLRFGLFPFHELPNAAKALVLSKNDVYAPRLSDLKNSGFAQKFEQFLQKNQKTKVFNIGQLQSPYLRSLREASLIDVQETDLGQLTQCLQKGVFPSPLLSPDDHFMQGMDYVLHPVSTENATNSDAPESLQRLFAYHALMAALGPHYFQLDKAQMQETWLEAARKANVVSPVTSLVALETQNDYARFGIDAPGNDDMIKNLAQQQSGAVPEPHEWALFALALLFVLWVRRRG